jgi:carboxymethylenebutenolidase
MKRDVSVKVDGRDMRILVGEPTGPGPHPAVLLAFHREGYSNFTEDVVETFSANGHLIAVPDLYHRAGAGWESAVKQRRDDNVLADMAAGLAYLKGRPDVDKGRIVIAGHCMGGRISLLVASTWPREFKACLSYYGGGTKQGWGESRPPIELLGAIACPVAGFFGNDDDNPSPEDADRIEARLADHGIPHEFHRFDGTGHGYMYRESKNFRAHATEQSWRLTFDFLSRKL